MKREETQSLFTLAGIPVLKMWELMNPYWPRAEDYYKLVVESPWWLVKTPAGMVRIGWRKRAIMIDWEDTAVRKIITEDNTTKDNTYVHAWSNEDALRYLTALGKEFQKPACPDDR